MTATGPATGWDTAWRQLGERVAAAPKSFAPTFAEAYRDFGRWVQGAVAAAPGAELHRRLADAADQAARQVADTASPQPYWSAVPTALMAALPSGPMAGLAADALARIVQWADEFAALPMLGPYRGWAQAAFAVQRAALAERAAATRLAAHYRTISAAALADFARFLRTDDGPPIATLRALYGAWVERAEAAYAAHVMEQDFAIDFGAWVNAGNALRAAVASVSDRVATSFDWPQRAEINALLRRQRELEREIAELRARASVGVPAVAEDAAATVAPSPARHVDAPARVRPIRSHAPRAARPKAAAAPVRQAVPRPPVKAQRKRKTSADEFDIAVILSDDA